MSQQKPKRLYRSRRDRQIAGVCGGLGEYFNVDPTLIRILWVLLTLTIGTGLMLYIILAIIIPEESMIQEGGFKRKNDDDHFV